MENPCKIENPEGHFGKLSAYGASKCLITGLIVIISVFLVALFCSTVIDIRDKIQKSENTITVSDTGTIYTKPDLALAVASVITEATTVAETIQENAKKMNAVIAFIKSQGVEDKDLKTTNFNIYPRYEYRKEETEIYPYPPGKRVLAGYEVSQSLQIKIRDMEKIGVIIQGATDAGANQVGDLQFTVDEEDALKAQARAEAINKAKAKAKELAGQLGIKLVRIINFSESGAVPYFYSMKEAAPLGMGGGETLQIETGENKIEVTVSITYEIR